MSSLTFAVEGARAEPYAASPTIVFELRVTSDDAVDAAVLNCQVRIEAQLRDHDPREEPGLRDLFGGRERWDDTLRSLLWAHVPLVLPAFRGSTRVELPVPCTYDLEVAWGKYLRAVETAPVPVRFLFSGTLFRGGTAEPVPWSAEAGYDLPAGAWQAAIDALFPGTAWLRLPRHTFEALDRFRSQRALPTWEAAVDALLAEEQ